MFTLIYVGWIVSIIGALPLVLGGAMNMMKASVMVRNMEHVGFSPDVLPVSRFIKFLIAAASLVPPTSFIGVILATGWMGGAISAHIRVKDPYFVQVLIPS